MATASHTLSDPQAEKLRRIQSIPALVKYLDEELGWPVGVDDWEDAVYNWEPEELNLKAEHQVAIKSIMQLKPLVTGQPWGIFFVDFDKGQLPITVLRRMLNGLVIKSRVKGSGHQTWLARDLLFVSSFGEGNAAHPREIALAHFTDESALGDLPTLRVLGWDDDDTAAELGYVAKTLKEKLRWPAHTTTKVDQDAWRAQWASAFSLKYRQVINDSKTLALGLAELAKRTRSRVNTVLALESDNGHLRQLHKAFKDNLIADLSDDAFADMFAQTITYGLFTARASRTSGALVADNLSDMVPSTNPFLKELLADFLSAAGRDRQKKKRVDFDELGINEVVTTLRDVPMDAVLRAFNKDKPGDDPVIHFYEDFLKAYDKKMRAKRGVFYTPSPVVQFIVRSVGEILKTEFGIEDGLASTITWGEYLALSHSREGGHPDLKLPKFCTADTPFVQILDPATGTGTFIVEVITQVHAHMLAKWRKQGLVTKAQWQPLWVEYVKHHLLPRLYAFELMMAPYAIAHMKIGLKLGETGYTFPEDGPRVNVFLTNALEPAHAINPGLAFEAPMLAHEAAAANRVKEQLAATVVVGNPPYARHSSNNGVVSIVALVQDYKRGFPDLSKPGQGKPLQNDYVKFIRFLEDRASTLPISVVGLITANTFIDNPTFKGMRRHLLQSFSKISLVNLHGHPQKDRDAIRSHGDENVFDIKEGTAVSFLTKGTRALDNPLGITDLFGSRQLKYDLLLADEIGQSIDFRPTQPAWLYLPVSEVAAEERLAQWSLPTVFSPNGDPAPGVVTTHDQFAISWTAQESATKVRSFLSSRDEYEAREKFDLCTQEQWNYERAKAALATGRWVEDIGPITYRPFDNRSTIYNSHVAVHRRERITSHMRAGPNLGMVTARSNKSTVMDHFFVAKVPTETKCGEHTTQSVLFPLWLYSSSPRIANLSASFLDALQSALGLTANDYRPEGPTAPLHAEKIFHYLYAVLHSPDYRLRYAAFLRTDFPRIPIPGSRAVFDALAQLGGQMVHWHLLEHSDATKIVAGGARKTGAVDFFGTDFSLQKVAEKGKALAELSGDVGKVYINATSGFANVYIPVWQHTIGGYQVLHKWLDDRRKAKRSLSQDDITHWLRIYASLEATQKLMLQVDEAIDTNGGWPGESNDTNAPSAFSQTHPPPDAATLAIEQMAQKEQLKAQKKAATAKKKRAGDASNTRAIGLFDSDDDLDELAEAAGAPPRPKARATPAKAAGGKASTGSTRTGAGKQPASAKAATNEFTDWRAMCAIRAVLARESPMARSDLIRITARELGFARTSPRIAIELEAAIRRAMKRGIASNERGTLSLVARNIEGYDRAFLKQHLLGCMSSTWCDKAEVPLRFARTLGFARTGSKIEELVWNLIRALQRGEQVQAEGRGASARYRKAPR
jgi:Type ISP C-terminal specificity domain